MDQPVSNDTLASLIDAAVTAYKTARKASRRKLEKAIKADGFTISQARTITDRLLSEARKAVTPASNDAVPLQTEESKRMQLHQHSALLVRGR